MPTHHLATKSDLSDAVTELKAYIDKRTEEAIRLAKTAAPSQPEIYWANVRWFEAFKYWSVKARLGRGDEATNLITEEIPFTLEIPLRFMVPDADPESLRDAFLKVARALGLAVTPLVASGDEFWCLQGLD